MPGVIVVARLPPTTGGVAWAAAGRSSVLSPGHSASSPPSPSLATRAQNASGVVCQEAGEGVRRPMATILLIDDEAEVRMLCQIVLEGAGYHVLTAESGRQGLRL